MSSSIRRRWKPDFEHLLKTREKDLASEPELALYRVGAAYQDMARNVSEAFTERYPAEWDELEEALAQTLQGYQRHLFTRTQDDQLAWLVAEQADVFDELEYIDSAAELVASSSADETVQLVFRTARREREAFTKTLTRVTPTMLLVEQNLQLLKNTFLANQDLPQTLPGLRNSYFAEPMAARLEAYLGALRSDSTLSGDSPDPWTQSPTLDPSFARFEAVHQAARAASLSKLEVAFLMHDLNEEAER